MWFQSQPVTQERTSSSWNTPCWRLNLCQCISTFHGTHSCWRVLENPRASGLALLGTRPTDQFMWRARYFFEKKCTTCRPNTTWSYVWFRQHEARAACWWWSPTPCGCWASSSTTSAPSRASLGMVVIQWAVIKQQCLWWTASNYRAYHQPLSGDDHYLSIWTIINHQ